MTLTIIDRTAYAYQQTELNNFKNFVSKNVTRIPEDNGLRQYFLDHIPHFQKCIDLHVWSDPNWVNKPWDEQYNDRYPRSITGIHGECIVAIMLNEKGYSDIRVATSRQDQLNGVDFWFNNHDKTWKTPASVQVKEITAPTLLTPFRAYEDWFQPKDKTHDDQLYGVTRLACVDLSTRRVLLADFVSFYKKFKKNSLFTFNDLYYTLDKPITYVV